MDLTVKPGDDFYQYANGTWLKNNPVPPSKTRWGSFDGLREESSKRLQTLLEHAAANTSKDRATQMIGDLYASGMDSIAIERKGYDPIKSDLKRIASITDVKGIIYYAAAMRTNGSGSPLFGVNVGPDRKNVLVYIPAIGQGGTSLPDRDYYLKDDARSQKIKAAFNNQMVTMFGLAGWNPREAEASAAAVLRIETALAQAQMARVEMRDPYKTYNKVSLKDLNQMTPLIDWPVLFGAMKISFQSEKIKTAGTQPVEILNSQAKSVQRMPAESAEQIALDSVIVSNPAFLKAVNMLLSQVNIEDWRSYLSWNVIRNAAPYLSSAFVNADFELTKVTTGQKEQTPRWQRMSALIDRSLADLIGQLYVQQYFKPEAKAYMVQLVNNMQQAFASRINNLEWMSAATKARAQQKLNAIAKKIAYPDKWRTYDGIVINRNDFMGNLRSAASWAYNYNVSRMGKPVDRTEWGMTPPTINASYSPSNNDITFPAGILQFPFFDFGADDAVNYGGIAAVIGHEMTHGFDDQGRQFDADGNLKDWWTKDDADKFKGRANEVVEQYNALTVLDTIHVNGRLTLGENLADLGGLSIAYEAFTRTDEFKKGRSIDGFTPAQRFFLSWAQVWRSNALPETSAQLILTDPHSPGRHRGNAPLTNIDAWYDAFNVKPGDKMYKPASQRTHIW